MMQKQENRTASSALDRLSARVSVWSSSVDRRFTALPALVQVLLVYGASRLAGWFIFSSVALHQVYSPWKRGAMTYSEFVTIWDSDWYRRIADGGYPTALPLDINGHVAQNEWAFYPLYPTLVGALSKLTGVDTRYLAPFISLLAGFVAAWFIYRLFTLSLERSTFFTEPGGGQHHSTALWGLAAVSFSAVAPVLQTGYAEALGLLFLTWALLYLVQGKYLMLLLPALLAALTRPVGVPLGATVGLWWLVCWVQKYRQASEENSRVAAAVTASGATAVQLASALGVCAFAFIHPAHAWLVTGRIDAYTATETAWRAGGEHVLPFLPWVTQSRLYLGEGGLAVLLLVLLVFVVLMLSSPVRRVLPAPLLLWVWAYALYMLAFFNPQSSTFRLLLPLFPLLLPLVALSASRAYRWLLIGSGFALQYGWVGWLWHWKQLPGGGDYPP